MMAMNIKSSLKRKNDDRENNMNMILSRYEEKTIMAEKVQE